MARMPSSQPTEKVSGWPGALDGEWVEVLTYAGAGVREAVQDALMKVDADLATSGVTGMHYTQGDAVTVRRRRGVVNFCLYEEKEPGVKGPPIPFNDWTRDNMDPAIAAYVDQKILECWGKWRTITGQDATGTDREVAQARKPFQDGAEAPA